MLIKNLTLFNTLARYRLLAKQIFLQKNTFRRNQSMNNKQHSMHYSFIRFRRKLFCCKSTHICFEFRQKIASLAKQRRKIDSPKRRITIYTLLVFCLFFVVSPLFANSIEQAFDHINLHP